LIRKITPEGVVTTLAGSGSHGSTDGTGTAASFSYPQGVAVDFNSNVYVADQSNNLIRKITPAGVVTTLAGSGSEGSTNGTGTAASFDNPVGVAVDGSGNVYVADLSNNLIRKITPAGVVTTLAGDAGNNGSTNGTGTAALFYYPAGLAVDFSGNVYVADQYNHLIRKIATALPSGSTYGGSPLLLNFTTSKPTTDFVVDDISVTGGTLSSFTAISSTVYTAIFTPSAFVSSLVTIDVAAGSFTDVTGNNNTAATQFIVTYDLQPSAPTGLVVTSMSGQITLFWSANSESDFAKYYIYGGTSASPTTKVDSTANVSDTTKTITGLTNGTTYYYRISAVDNGGYESDKTSDVSATLNAVRTIRNGMFLSDATFATEGIVSMGLNMKSTDDVRGFQLNLEYDTSHVLFDTLIANDIINQFTLLANEPEKGKVKIVALSFTGEKIEKGVKNLLFIKFKIRDGAIFTHTKINISEPVLSDVNGSSIVPKVFPGYIVSNEQSYLTVSRIQPSWYFNLANVIDYAALQFTFNYNTSIVTVDSVKSADRTSNFNFNYNQPTKGKVNIVINSFDNTLLQKGSGYIAQLYFSAIDATQGKGDFSFSEAIGVDASGLVSQILTLDSYHINTPPVISEIADVSGYEDTPVTIGLTATDPEGDPITFSA
ncbi:MAG: Ig-like domain-containing protein, partial [Anaerolineales bacterium]|nr:Ig-like domain-containing protein [Anaerolineales bacterium]